MHVQRVMKNALVVSSTAVELASNFGGVPFAGAAAVLLGEIGRACEQVQIHKSECRLLFRHAQIILDALCNRSPGLEGTTLQQAADALELILLGLSEKMIKWSNWNVVRSYWKRDEISRGIRNASQELRVYQEKFHIQAQMAIVETLHENNQMRQRDQEEKLTLLHRILEKQEHTNSLLQMRQAGEPVVEEIMRDAQTELHAQPKDTPKYLEYEAYVLNLYNTTGVMPTLPNLNQEVVLKEGPIAGGPYSEVSLGLWLGKVEVALKSLRAVAVILPRAQKRFEHEITIWHTLEHPNILRFLGLLNNLGPHICVVSPWQSRGNVLGFTKQNPQVDRLKLLAGAARGIEYLHSLDKPVVHGNIKCANILVSEKGEALISDFGLSRVIEDITETSTYTTLTSSGSNRWCAPELMNEISSPTMATDVYSFSMAILECLTSERPFARIKRDPLVVLHVVERRRPPRPVGEIWDRWFTDKLWELLSRCWSHEPPHRPLMTNVAIELSELGQEVARRHLAFSLFV